MKNRIKIQLVLALSVLVLSCSKNEPKEEVVVPVYQEENFLKGFLSQSGYDQKTGSTINDPITYEFGVEFTPLVTGKMTSIVVKQPIANSSVRITIWEEITGSIIKTEVVKVLSSNTDFTFDIVDVLLVKNKKYAITMSANDYVSHTRANGSVTTYPLTVGNIRIDSYKARATTSQLYPNTAEAGYAGDLSFNFLRTE